MQKKEKEKLYKLYFKKLLIEQELKEIIEEFKKFNFKKFEEDYLELITDLEKEIIFEFEIKNNSLKEISKNRKLPYAVVRKNYLNGKEKIRIILSINMKDTNR